MVLKKKYKGTTLPEVLIAIVIISFTSAMGLTIYLNIQQNTQPFKHLKANELAQKFLVEAQKKHDYFDDTVKDEEFTIKKTISRNEVYPDCMVLKITVSTAADKKISELQKLVYANQ